MSRGRMQAGGAKLTILCLRSWFTRLRSVTSLICFLTICGGVQMRAGAKQMERDVMNV